MTMFFVVVGVATVSRAAMDIICLLESGERW